MLRHFVTYFIFVICFSVLTLMQIQVLDTSANWTPDSPSDPPASLSATATCHVENYPPLYVDFWIDTSGWSDVYSSEFPNQLAFGNYDLRYGSISVKWYPDPPDNRNQGVFEDGCDEYCNLSETYWWIGPGDISARNKAFIRNQDGHASDSGMW